MLTESAADVVVRSHPNSCSSGSISTAGTARTPADTSRITNVIATTTQA